MSAPFAITFFTLAFLGPIPFWHLLLHALLPAWRRSPRAYYALAAALWAFFIPLSWLLAARTPFLFDPSDAVTAAGLCVSGSAFLVALWAMAALTPRRFFVWAVLHPGKIETARVQRGPYRYTDHPTYLAVVTAAAANFLASGAAALLGAVAVIGLLLAIVAVLEQRELQARLNASLPEREFAPPPFAPTPRD